MVLCIRTSLAQTPSWAWVILCPWGHPVQRLGFYIPVPTPFPGLHPLDASTFPPAVTSKNIAEFAKCPLGRVECGLSHHPYRPLSTFEQNYTLNLFPGVPFTLWIPGAPLALETLVKNPNQLSVLLSQMSQVSLLGRPVGAPCCQEPGLLTRVVNM